MKTVYCARLEAPLWTEFEHEQARSAVDRWVEEQYPFADRGPGVSVRVDDEEPLRWWRYSIGVSLGRGDIHSTVVSASSHGSTTSVEIRLSMVPGGSSIRSRSQPVPAVAVRELARTMVSTCAFFDAGVRVADGVRIVGDESGAQEVAAFCDAPSRSLPIVIESVPTKGDPVFRADRLSLTLSGLVHIVRVEGDPARAAFNEFFGEDLLLPQGLALVWPDRRREVWSGNGLTPAGGDEIRKQCVPTITNAAAESLGPLRPPLFRRRTKEDSGLRGDGPGDQAETSDHPTTVVWDEYRAALDGWQESEERITELEEALTEADRVIAEKQQVLERGDELRDRLVLQNTELAIRLGGSPRGLMASNALDAVQQAARLCEHLTFHPGALESAGNLEGVDANRLLQDLVRLDVVAGDWQSGRINDASLTISCRSMGLNYAGGISDTAEYKYGEDYAFTWRGRTEYAVAHIRNGRGTRLYRVHIFFDKETQQVVVAYVGRHLRGKQS